MGSSSNGPPSQPTDKGDPTHLGSSGLVGTFGASNGAPNWQEGLLASIAQSGSSGRGGSANAGAGTLTADMATSAPTAAAVLIRLPILNNIAELIDDPFRAHPNTRYPRLLNRPDTASVTPVAPLSVRRICTGMAMSSNNLRVPCAIANIDAGDDLPDCSHRSEQSGIRPALRHPQHPTGHKTIQERHRPATASHLLRVGVSA
jgi:hypothetical protein